MAPWICLPRVQVMSVRSFQRQTPLRELVRSCVASPDSGAVLLCVPLPSEREQTASPNAQTEVLASCNLGEARTRELDKCHDSTKVPLSRVIQGQELWNGCQRTPQFHHTWKQVWGRLWGKAHAHGTATLPRWFCTTGGKWEHKILPTDWAMLESRETKCVGIICKT